MATLTLPTQGGDAGTWGTEMNTFVQGSLGPHLSETNVDFSSTGQTTLYTVPTGKKCVITAVLIEAGADALTTDITMGGNGTFDDWLGTNGFGSDPTQLDNLDAADDVALFMANSWNTDPAIKLEMYAAATTFKIDIVVGNGGATNTVYVFGVLLDA